MKKGSLKVARGAIAVGLSFVLVGTMGENLTVVNAETSEKVMVHHEDRMLPEKFELEKYLVVEEIKNNKNSNKKTKVLVRPKNINRRYL